MVKIMEYLTNLDVFPQFSNIIRWFVLKVNKLSDCLKFVVALHTQAVILETSAVDMQYVLRKKDCMAGVNLLVHSTCKCCTKTNS